MRTWTGIAGAVAAGGALLTLALHGERPEAGLARYQPAGVMVALPPERVTGVEVRSARGTLRYTRTPDGWIASPGHAPGRPDPSPLVEQGLRLLHGSAPQRVMAGPEIRGLALAEMGLAPPLLTVRVEAPGAELFSIEIGGPNPQGLARYARVSGRDAIVLLNHYVAEAWEAAIAP